MNNIKNESKKEVLRSKWNSLSYFAVEAFAEEFLIKDNDLTVELHHIGGIPLVQALHIFLTKKSFLAEICFFRRGQLQSSIFIVLSK